MNRKRIPFTRQLPGILAALTALTLLVGCGGKDAPAASASSSAVISVDPLPPTNPDAVVALHWDNGSTVISLATDENGVWHWTANPDFPLDASYPEALLSTLAELTPQQTLTEPDTLDAYGLSNPTRVLTLTRADESTVVYSLGKNTTDGASCYLLMEKDPSVVYIIDGALRDQLDVAVFDMMDLPRLPDVAVENMTRVEIKGAADTLMVAFPNAAGEGEEVQITWRSSGANVTDWVQGLLTTLSDLEMDACADFNPTEQAVSLCGFDKPRITLSLKWRLAGVDKELTLCIGNASADGSGYYVRYNDDPNIYIMTTARLEPILDVAQNGLGE